MSDIALGLYKYVDGVNDTPFPSSGSQAFLTGWQYNAKRMGGAPSITGGTIIFQECLDDEWSDDVCVKFRGEAYFSLHAPTSSYSKDSIMYEHKADFLSERTILDAVYFYDVVSQEDSGGKPISNSAKFVFNGTIEEFITRVNASLVKSGIGKTQTNPNGYEVVLDENQEHADEIKFLKFDSKYISEVLQEGFKNYGIPYYFDGKTCHFGDKDATASVLDDVVFEYGKKKSLVSINKSNANTKIVNRITGVGSPDNIPYFYPNSCEKGMAEVSNISSSTIQRIDVVDDERFALKVEKDTVLIYDEYEDVPIDISMFYVNGEAYTKGTKIDFSGRPVHIVIPINITLDCINLDVILKPWSGPLRPAQYVTINNVTISPTISGATIDVNTSNASIRISTTNSVTEGIYNISFDASFADVVPYDGNFCDNSEGVVTAIAWKDTNKNIYYQDLAEIGLSVVGTPAWGDSFKQVIDTLIPYQPNLMPSIYRESNGNERFYNALNNTYINPATGDYYEFPKPYVSGKPKEYIQDNKDIKPTIKGMTNAAGLPIDEVIKFAFDENDNDEIDEQGNYLHPYFFALLHKTDGQFGFNLFDQANEKEQMSLNFNSGKLGGCNFIIGVSEESQRNTVQIELDANLEPMLDSDGHPILKRDENGDVLYGLENRQAKQVPQPWQNDTRNNEVWVALKKEDTTYGELMPNVSKNYLPDDDDPQGNIFVILNITLPKAYKLAAEQAMTNFLLASMSEMNSEHWNFSIDYSRIYFKEEPAIMGALDENKKIKIRYNGNIYERYILSYTYKTLLNESLPSISVELAEQLITSANPFDSAINQVTNLVEVQANAIIGYQQVARLARLALPASAIRDAGTKVTPIYFDGETPKTITGLDVPEDIHSGNNIEADGGVSAMGINDLGISGGGGGGGGGVETVSVNGGTPVSPDPYGNVDLDIELADLEQDSTHRTVTDAEKAAWNAMNKTVVMYADLDSTETESTGKIATAKAVAINKANIGIDEFDEYDPNKVGGYKRGEYVKITTSGIATAYRFKMNVAQGATIAGRVERVTYKTLAQPLALYDSELEQILD